MPQPIYETTGGDLMPHLLCQRELGTTETDPGGSHSSRNRDCHRRVASPQDLRAYGRRR